MSFNLVGGELTMSETGRLGVICSCHGLHMSVAKFSEVTLGIQHLVYGFGTLPTIFSNQFF